ncbi:hypothetical protein [Candidatus Nanohalovita haloferacivicina]|uniref:hypothetical protein n=1 Tax=Candidatus Nanohalovita haloferacivicina TaxID=2978046 RepID=UPI00325F98A6|nr:hypothetical protein HBNXNv_1090 [Candidatus Nanohalobia archaeon BNXNv]
MRKSYAAALLLLLIAVISAPAAAQIAGGGPSQAFYNEPLNFIDSLTVSDINNGQDFLVFVIIPLIGVYGLMWFIFSKVLKRAENNFEDNNGGDDLSEMGQKAAQLMALAVAVVTVMRHGNYGPGVALLLLLLALLFVLRHLLGVNLPGLPDIDIGGGDIPDSIDVNAPDSIDVNAPDSIDVNVPDGSDSSDDSGDSGGGPPGSPYQNVDIDLDPQMAQQVAAAMQQQQQQMGMAMTPGMMQFMALLQGRFGPGNGGIVVNAPNAEDVTIQQQQFSGLMQMMVKVMSEGDEEFDMEVVNQMMKIVVNYGGPLDETLIQRLEQYFQKVENNPKIVQINNVEIEKVVNQQYYDISNVLVNQLGQYVQQNNVNVNQQAFSQFINLLELNIEVNDGTVVIQTGSNVQIDVSVFVQLISVIENLPSSAVGPAVEEIVSVFLSFQGPLNQDALVQITNIIVNVEQGGGGSDEPDLEGDNWEIFQKVVRNSDLRDSAKEMLLRTLNGDHQRAVGNNGSMLMAFYNHIQSVPRDSIVDASQEIVDYFKEHDARRIDETDFRAIIDILERNWTLDKSHMRHNAGQEYQHDAEIETTFGNLIEALEKDEQTRKQELSVDEQILEELKEAMQVIEQSQLLKFVAAINKIDFDRFDQILNEEGIATANQYLDSKLSDPEIKDWLSNPEFIKSQHKQLEKLHNRLDEARQDLEQNMEWEDGEMEQEAQILDVLDSLENQKLPQIRSAMGRLEDTMIDTSR